MLTPEQVKLIAELCLNELDSNQIKQLLELHVQVYGIDFDYKCAPCIQEAKYSLIAHAFGQLINCLEQTKHFQQNGHSKN